jgi:ferritin-like protein
MAERPDSDLLEDLLALEQRLIAAYEAALRRDAIAPRVGAALRDQELEHARALERALAGAGPRSPRASVPPPELGAALRSRADFARFALDLEAEAVAAYAAAAAAIRNPRLRQPLGSIMACEAAHEVALRDALGERSLVD